MWGEPGGRQQNALPAECEHQDFTLAPDCNHVPSQVSFPTVADILRQKHTWHPAKWTTKGGCGMWDWKASLYLQVTPKSQERSQYFQDILTNSAASNGMQGLQKGRQPFARGGLTWWPKP